MKKTILVFFLSCLIFLAFSMASNAGESVDIGVIFSFTGPAAFDNEPSVLGVKIAAEELEGRGGVSGVPVNIKTFDNLSTPIGSGVAAEKAVAAGVVAIVGAAWSSHSIAVAKVAQKARVPMISNYSTNPAVTKIGDCIFRVCYTDDFQGKVMALFARESLKARTSVVFTDLTSDFSIGLSRIFSEHFEAQGGEIVFECEYKLKKMDLVKITKLTEGIDADLYFFSGHDETGAIAAKLQKAGRKAEMVGGDSWANPSFYRKGGNKLKSGFFCTHWSKEWENGISREFVKKYGNLEQFGAGTALAYDAVMLLADAIGRAGATDREEIRNALAETMAFQGVTGEISFNENGDPKKNAAIVKIVDGETSFFKTMKP